MNSAQPDGGDRSAGRRRRTAAERRGDLVLGVLTGRHSLASSARRAGVTEAEFSRWISRFVEAGEVGLRYGGKVSAAALPGDLAAQNDALRAKLTELRDEAARWKTMAGDLLGPFSELEAIRTAERMSVSRFCALLSIPCRSYFRGLVLLRSGNGGKKRRPAPCTESCASIVAAYMAVWPRHGHRKLHALMAADGHVTSPSTVLRAMRLLQRRSHER